MKSLFTFSNLYLAYLDCRKRKRNTINALKFECHLEDNLWRLVTDLQNRTYTPGNSICFAVDKPVIREIFAADFRDRIIHHLFVRTVEPYFEKLFIYDSYACRKGKGTLFGVRRLQKFIRQIQNIDPKNYNDWWYLKADISGFFMHINKDILYQLVEKKIAVMLFEDSIKKELLWLAKVIIFHNPTKNFQIKGSSELLAKVPKKKSLFGNPQNVGLPIGDLTSQFFANIYLNELDQFIKKQIKCKFYGRYVDDFFIIHKDKQFLVELRGMINKFLEENLFLELNFKKCQIQKLSYGIDFIGYFVKPWRIYIRKRIIHNFKNKIWVFEKHQGINRDDDKIKKSIASYIGYFKQANSYNFIIKTIKKHPWIKNI